MRSTLAVILALLLALPVYAGEADAASTTAAAKKAADFLIQQQNDDGTFGKAPGAKFPGVVGLVVKGLASSPDKHRENNEKVAKAVKYLLAKQMASGAIALPDGGLENYNTAVAIVALISVENPAHKDAIEKAVKYCQSCQLVEEQGYNEKEHPRAYGGIGYGNSKNPDLSNAGFWADAMKANGVKEGTPAWDNLVKFMKRCQDNDETNPLAEMKGGDNSGGMVYRPGVSEQGTYKAKSGKEMPKPYGNMTYQAVKMLVYAGVKKDDPVMQAAFKWIKNNYSVEQQPAAEKGQGYYYYVLAFAKAFSAMEVKELELADGRKVNWAKDLAAQLIKLQKADGSFVNEVDRWWESDPVLTTSYALDALNLCIAAMK